VYLEINLMQLYTQITNCCFIQTNDVQKLFKYVPKYINKDVHMQKNNKQNILK